MKHIKFNIQLDEDASIPVRAHDTDVGYDVRLTWFAYKDSYSILNFIKSNMMPETQTRLVDYFAKENNFATLPIGCKHDDIWTVAQKRPCYIICHTGVHVQPVNTDYYIEAVPNSRVGKRPVMLGNGIGIIDPGYTGEVLFIFKVMPWATEKDIEEYFAENNVIGQFIVRERYGIEWNLVSKLEETDRGDGGFGSTAK